MMDNSPQRADPFAPDTGPDLSEFKPRSAPRPAPPRETIARASEESGAPSRERAKPKPKVQRRRVTGRTEQINIRATQETIDRLNAVADKNGWVLGEVLERALDALASQGYSAT
jgi:hypothetical protein